MTFKKGLYKEKEGLCFQVSYGLERWWLIICKKEDINNKNRIVETYFKLKKDAIHKLNFYFDNISFLKEGGL